MHFVFGAGPAILGQHGEQLQEVSGGWLRDHRSPELGYSVGTLATLDDPDIRVALAFGATGRLEGFVSWLPVPMRNAWTLDLMRRRPDAAYGVIEALIVRSIEEARSHNISLLSLGMTPRIIPGGHGSMRWIARCAKKRLRPHWRKATPSGPTVTWTPDPTKKPMTAAT